MYIFIVNPIAGNRKAKKVIRSLSRTSVYKKMQKKIYMTTGMGHAKQLIQFHTAPKNYKRIDGIVIVGGDGTLHEVINGLGNRRLPIAYIPTGSGNDFKRGAHITLSPEQTVKNLYNRNNPVWYWTGTYYNERNETCSFLNCLGVGFDAKVAAQVNQSKVKSLLHRFGLGKIMYTAALMREIFFYKSFPVQIQADEQTYNFPDCLFAVVNGHPYFGGGMKINPQAYNNQETLSVLVVDSIAKWKVLALFFTVFFGTHLRFKEVHVLKSKHIRIKTERPVLIQSDGETGINQDLTVAIAEKPLEIYGALPEIQA